MCSNILKSTYICRCEGCEKHSNKEGKMKKKNKWYEVLGAGLLSVSAMYLCTSLMVTGCSVDDGSLDALDANETSEVVESGSDEEVESSEAEKSSKPEETADAEEKPTSTPETEEPAAAEEKAPAAPAETETVADTGEEPPEKPAARRRRTRKPAAEKESPEVGSSASKAAGSVKKARSGKEKEASTETPKRRQARKDGPPKTVGETLARRARKRGGS